MRFRCQPRDLAQALCLVMLVMLVMSAVTAGAAEPIPVWPAGAPQLAGVDPAHVPTLTAYPAPGAEGKRTAVLICPAGGYKHHSNSAPHAEWLNSLGISAYVVTYRLPVHGYKHPAPLDDARRALRTIRHNAEAWGIDPARVGVMGGSSGGHVTTTLATHWDKGDAAAADPIERQGCRPDFTMIVDPVVTMQGRDCHGASRGRLLPADPPQPLVDDLSNELRVNADTPPCFVFAGGQDQLVPAENAIGYFLALRRQGVAFSELHVMSHGGHGFTSPDWHVLCADWMRRLGVLSPEEGGQPWPQQFVKGAWGRDPP